MQMNPFQPAVRKPSEERQLLSSAVIDIMTERNRQIVMKGWAPEHDDQHDCGELSRAASCYARHVGFSGWLYDAGNPSPYRSGKQPDCWPWAIADWKPKNPRQDLIKAAALIIAEIERLDRIEGNHHG